MATESDAFKPFPVDWRFLPEPALEVKDWLRAKWIGGIRLEERSSRLQRLWGASLARHWVVPVVRAGIVFVHVPRTGGTSVSSQLYGRNLPHLGIATWRGLLGEAGRELPSFSVIREPLERLISLYAFVRQGGTSLMAAPRYDPCKLSRAANFEDFIARTLALEADCAAPAYIRPQSSYICDEAGRAAVDELFSFASRRLLAERLRARLGLASIPHLNASRPVDATVSATLRSRIEQHYATDFEIYQRIEESGGSLRQDWRPSG